MSQTAFRAIVSGRVQLVMYRDFTQRNARRFGIVGEVQNLPNGTVSVTAEGEKEKLDALLLLLHKGPFLADVKDVAVEWVQPSGVFGGFAIRYS